LSSHVIEKHFEDIEKRIQVTVAIMNKIQKKIDDLGR